MFLKKVKFYIENSLEEEKSILKKYAFKVEIISDDKLIIPEYKIELQNKSKKIINKVEYINKIFEIKKKYSQVKSCEV